MNDNIEKIELLLSQLSLVDGAKENMFSSIAWSFAVRITNLLNALDNTRNEEAIPKLEEAINSTGDILTWASLQCNKDFAPTAEDVIKLLSSPAHVNILDVQSFAEIMGVDPEEVMVARKEDAQHQANDIKNNADDLTKRVARYLSATPSSDSEISINEQSTLSICNKVIQKTEQYSRNKLNAAYRIRNPEIQKAIAAERVILMDVKNQAEVLGKEMYDIVNNSSAVMNEGSVSEMH